MKLSDFLYCGMLGGLALMLFAALVACASRGDFTAPQWGELSKKVGQKGVGY